MSAEFCDSNVLVHAYDVTAGTKHDCARDLMRRLWQSGEGALSVQALQEFFVTVTRKVAQPLSNREARQVVADFATWHVVTPTPADVLEAIDSAERWQVSFWDAMVLMAARSAGAEVLWSEDLNAEQRFDGLIVRNPVAEMP